VLKSPRRTGSPVLLYFSSRDEDNKPGENVFKSFYTVLVSAVATIVGGRIPVRRSIDEVLIIFYFLRLAQSAAASGGTFLYALVGGSASRRKKSYAKVLFPV